MTLVAERGLQNLGVIYRNKSITLILEKITITT